MFCFGFCFQKTAEAVNSKMTDWWSSELIGYQMWSFMQSFNLETRVSILFCFIGYLFIDLSSSII